MRKIKNILVQDEEGDKFLVPKNIMKSITCSEAGKLGGLKGGKSKSIKKMRAFKKNSKLRWSGKGVK